MHYILVCLSRVSTLGGGVYEPNKLFRFCFLRPTSMSRSRTVIAYCYVIQHTAATRQNTSGVPCAAPAMAPAMVPAGSGAGCGGLETCTRPRAAREANDNVRHGTGHPTQDRELSCGSPAAAHFVRAPWHAQSAPFMGGERKAERHAGSGHACGDGRGAMRCGEDGLPLRAGRAAFAKTTPSYMIEQPLDLGLAASFFLRSSTSALRVSTSDMGEGGDSCAHQSHVCLGTGLDGGEASFVRHCDAGQELSRLRVGGTS